MTTDNCKLNFHIQIHMYSMYTVHVCVMKRYMHRSRTCINIHVLYIRIQVCKILSRTCMYMYAVYSTQHWILLPVIVHKHVVINMES